MTDQNKQDEMNSAKENASSVSVPTAAFPEGLSRTQEIAYGFEMSKGLSLLQEKMHEKWLSEVSRLHNH